MAEGGRGINSMGTARRSSTGTLLNASSTRHDLGWIPYLDGSNPTLGYGLIQRVAPPHHDVADGCPRLRECPPG